MCVHLNCTLLSEQHHIQMQRRPWTEEDKIELVREIHTAMEEAYGDSEKLNDATGKFFPIPLGPLAERIHRTPDATRHAAEKLMPLVSFGSVITFMSSFMPPFSLVCFSVLLPDAC